MLGTADMRTEHEAKPPLQGLKYACNLWIHMYDFRTPNRKGCDMDERVTEAPRDAVLEQRAEL